MKINHFVVAKKKSEFQICREKFAKLLISLFQKLVIKFSAFKLDKKNSRNYQSAFSKIDYQIFSF